MVSKPINIKVVAGGGRDAEVEVVDWGRGGI